MALAAAAAGARSPAPNPVPIPLPLGEETIPLALALEVETADAPAAAGAIAWRTRADGTWQGAAAGPRWEAELTLAPQAGGARALEVVVRWRAPAELRRLAVTLRWPGAPAAVDRALAWSAVAAPLRVERGTPLVVEAGAVVLTGGAGLAAAEVRALAGAEGPLAQVALVLDDAAARPFSTYEACLAALPQVAEGQAVPWGALERRRALAGAPRAPGDVDAARALLHPRADGPFLPVVVERWPAGTRAAVVVTDHADRTDAAALRALLYGDSDPRAEGGVGAGLLGRGLAITRSFFVHDARGGLDDPEIRPLADALAASGSEVALHSITPGRDGREAVRLGLQASAAWAPAVWIDHQPYTNCEALSAQGSGAEGPYGIRDLLAPAGVRWGWAAGDLGSGATRIVNLLGGAPGEARAAFFPLPQDPRVWIFRSSMFHDAPAALAAALSDAALERLEAERGLFVGHTYLGPSPRTTRGEDQRRRLVVEERAPGHLVLAPALDAALARVAARVAAGRLASLTWSAAGDRLRALGAIELAYRPDGAAELRNLGEAPVPALTVALPAAGLEVSVEGALLLGREDEGELARLWFDLPAGGRVVLRAARGHLPVPLLELR